MSRESASTRPVLSYAAGRCAAGTRALPAEVAVALSYDGATQAVMMATPADLEDFARGFTLTEGIAAPEDIAAIEPVELAQGIDLRIWLRPGASARLAERRRTMTGPVGCGLCGLDSLEAAMRPAVPVVGKLRLGSGEVLAAAAALVAHQPLHDATRAVHAAGFWRPGQGITAAREDVGRHNALDKLAGALLARGETAAEGAVVLTSRLSIDLVQKLCRMGVPLVVAASAPTAAAVDLAAEAGLTVAALAREDRFQIFAHPYRIAIEDVSHVA
jgi:formate dehydrogenase accessory protein FdhD